MTSYLISLRMRKASRAMCLRTKTKIFAAGKNNDINGHISESGTADHGEATCTITYTDICPSQPANHRVLCGESRDVKLSSATF